MHQPYRHKSVDSLSLLGTRINRLTVLSVYSPLPRTNGERRCICRCECGRTIETRTSHVVNGNTKSCGCLHALISAGHKTQEGKALQSVAVAEMLGHQFGALLVVRRAGCTKKGITWQCICACGTSVVLPGWQLRAGHYKTCMTTGHYEWLAPIGKRQGSLTVIGHAPGLKRGLTARCRCECGAEVTHNIRADGQIGTPRVESCGCAGRDALRTYVRRRTVEAAHRWEGAKFGHLTHLRFVENGVSLFRCDCGSETEKQRGAVAAGKTRTCGQRCALSQSNWNPNRASLAETAQHDWS